MCPIAARLRSMTAVMSTNVVGLKLHSSGWWGSNRNSAGGRIVANALDTPAPAASPRARSTAAWATGWSGLNGSVSVWVTRTSGPNALDVLDGLALLLPQLARLAALTVGERDDLGRPARLDGLGNRAAGAPDE